MKTIFICTHCVLILTLITLTLLLINSALSLADSVDNVEYNQFNKEFKKSFQEDTNHYSAAISSSDSNLNPNPNLNSNSFNTYQSTSDRLNEKFVDKSSVNEDDQLNNWDPNVYEKNYENSYINAQQSGSSSAKSSTNSQEVNLNKTISKDEKSDAPRKTDQSNRRFKPCKRNIGNITVKVNLILFCLFDSLNFFH